MKNFLKLLPLIFLVLTNMSYAESGIKTAAKDVPAKTQVTEDENIYSTEHPNIMVMSSQPEFVLKLKSNPTTGYSWFLREYDKNLITPIKHEFKAPESKLLGAPGYELWSFKVNRESFIVPTQTIIRMIYTRPGQGTDSSTQVVFRITTSKDQ